MMDGARRPGRAQGTIALARRYWKRFVLDVAPTAASSVRTIAGYNSYLSVLASAREHASALEVRARSAVRGAPLPRHEPACARCVRHWKQCAGWA
jgi:hypothetical protein